MTNDQPLFEPNTGISRLVKALGILLILLAFGAFSFYMAFNNPFNDFGVIAGQGISILGLTIVIFIMGARNSTYKFYNDRIERLNLINQARETILLRDIDSWDEVDVVTKKGIIQTLYLFSGERRFMAATPGNYNDYAGLKSYITKNKKRNDTDWQAAMQNDQKPYYKGMVGAGAALLLLGLLSMQDKKQAINPQTLTTVSGPLANAEFKKTGKSGSWLLVTLQNYSGFKFIMQPGAGAAITGYRFLASTQAGDTIQMQIPADEFNSKLIHQQPLSLWQRLYCYPYINAYGLTKNGTQVASVNTWNFNNAGKQKLYWINPLIWGAMLLFIGFSMMLTKKRMKQTIT